MENNIEVTAGTTENRQRTSSEREPLKTRRVGTITVGLSMIVFGSMFLMCSLFQTISYQMVFALWPVILIGLGTELLVFHFLKGKLIYDKGSVFIMILMFFLSAGMAVIDVCWKMAEYYIPYF